MNMYKPGTHCLRQVAAAALLAAAFGYAGAAQLPLPTNPLSVSNDVAPNILMMVDNSGSMNNVVIDDPYNPAISYAPVGGCPMTNQVPANTDVDLHVPDAATGVPRIAYSTVDAAWGTAGGQKCFVTGASNYLAQLNVNSGAGTDAGAFFSPGSYLPARYDGNYLNWYFNPSSVAGVTWNAGNTQRIKPISATTFAQSRIQIARATGTQLITDMDARLRVGFATYNSNTSGQGGELRAAIGVLGAPGSAQRLALTTGTGGISTLATFGNTPLGETLAGIGRYFTADNTDNLGNIIAAQNNTLTLHPATAMSATAAANTIFPTTLRNASSPTPPITLSCQQSFAVLLTDGRPQGDQGDGGEISTQLADYDRDCVGASPACRTFDRKALPAAPAPDQYESAGSGYLDDVAQALFQMDLRPDFPAEIPVPPATVGVQFKNNVVTHMIGFADDDARNDPLIANTAAQGGGLFFAAADSAALTTAFTNIITDIIERSASFSSAALSSTSLNAGSRLFQAGFNSGEWSGSLDSYFVSTDISSGSCPGTARGRRCPTADWNAATELDTPVTDTRRIITFNNTTKAGIPFLWANLPAAQQGLLNRNPNVVPIAADTRGPERLNYLRGDRSLESTGNFRDRTSRLGDIVDSDPTFVGAPNSSLPFSGYSTFRSANRNRKAMVYVGANDGMLHAFQANDIGSVNGGTELLAYVPGMLYGTNAKPRLAQLTARPYTHVFGVDGSPAVGDVEVGPALTWKTYLVGAMRYGAQGLYALDVTDPSTFSEGTAASIVKWEFTSADDADLGYTFSQPSIVKMKNGKWAAIIGNGYNNREPDGTASATGRAALFVIFLDGPTGTGGTWTLGTDYLKFAVGTSPLAAATDNGLATPAAVDIDGDRVIDYIYAGDLQGNMWQFNVNCNPATSGCTWQAAYGGNPLFTALSNTSVPQPITAPPQVGLNLLTPDPDDLIVFFGTGQYIASGDSTQANQQNQTFYGIFANPIMSVAPFAETTVSPNPTKANLLRQTVLLETGSAAGPVRVTSQNPINLSAPVSHKGWYIDLYNTATAGVDPTPASGLNLGERQVSRPILRNGRIVFSTLIPPINPCDFGGSGWLMEIDARTGGRPSRPALDVTNDLTVDASDFVTVTLPDGTTTQVFVSGRGTSGIVGAYAVLDRGDGETKFGVDESGNTIEIGEAASGRTGRVTWREINP